MLRLDTTSKGGDFYLATSGDFLLATCGDFLMAMDTRRGPYRILYHINEAAIRVEILSVDHRADAFRNG